MSSTLKMWAVKSPIGALLEYTVTPVKEDALDNYFTCYRHGDLRNPVWGCGPLEQTDEWRLERQKGFELVQVTVQEEG